MTSANTPEQKYYSKSDKDYEEKKVIMQHGQYTYEKQKKQRMMNRKSSAPNVQPLTLHERMELGF